MKYGARANFIGRLLERPLYLLAIALIALLPMAGIVVRALADSWHGASIWPNEMGWRGIETVWSDPQVRSGLSNSVTLGLGVALVAVVLAWPVARFQASSRSLGGWVLLATPVLLPGLVIGDGLTTWMLRLGIADRLWSVGIADLAVAVPYATLALVPAFTEELAELEVTAATSGASPLRRLFDVALPTSKHHVALAAALAFTVSWSQYSTTLTIGGGTPSLPLVMVPLVRNDPQVGAVLSILFLIPPAVALAGAAFLAVRATNASGKAHPVPPTMHRREHGFTSSSL